MTKVATLQLWMCQTCLLKIYRNASEAYPCDDAPFNQGQDGREDGCVHIVEGSLES